MGKILPGIFVAFENPKGGTGKSTLKALGVDEIIVVVGHEAKQVEDIVDGVTFVYQDQQLGTGHAVLQAKDVLADNNNNFIYT